MIQQVNNRHRGNGEKSWRKKEKSQWWRLPLSLCFHALCFRRRFFLFCFPSPLEYKRQRFPNLSRRNTEWKAFSALLLLSLKIETQFEASGSCCWNFFDPADVKVNLQAKLLICVISLHQSVSWLANSNFLYKNKLIQTYGFSCLFSEFSSPWTFSHAVPFPQRNITKKHQNVRFLIESHWTSLFQFEIEQLSAKTQINFHVNLKFARKSSKKNSASSGNLEALRGFLAKFYQLWPSSVEKILQVTATPKFPFRSFHCSFPTKQLQKAFSARPLCLCWRRFFKFNAKRWWRWLGALVCVRDD